MMRRILKMMFLLCSMCLAATIALASCTAKADNGQTDTFTTKNGKTIAITAIKHGSIRINYDGKEIEVDPVSGLKPKTDYSKMPKADYILVTHEHFDHLDVTAINELEKPSTTIITNKDCAEKIGKGKVMRNGDHLQLADDISIDAVPAYNITPGKTDFHPKGRDNGFILTLDGFRIYISGDTECIPEMSQIKNIDVAFLSTNQPYTMTPEQTAKAARTIKPKVLFPYHYSDTNVSTVVSLLKGSGIDVRIRNYQ